MIIDFDGVAYELSETDVKELLELADELSYLVTHHMPYAEAGQTLAIISAADAYRELRSKYAWPVESEPSTVGWTG